MLFATANKNAVGIVHIGVSPGLPWPHAELWLSEELCYCEENLVSRLPRELTECCPWVELSSFSFLETVALPSVEGY